MINSTESIEEIIKEAKQDLLNAREEYKKTEDQSDFGNMLILSGKLEGLIEMRNTILKQIEKLNRYSILDDELDDDDDGDLIFRAELIKLFSDGDK